MSERNKEGEKSIEEVWAVTQAFIQPVLAGEVEEVKIFKDGGHLTGEPIVEFYPTPGIGREVGKEIIERLVEELEIDLTKGEEISYKPLDPLAPHDTAVAIYHYQTKDENIVLATKDIGPWDAGYYWVRTWGIKNLHPKSRLQKAKERIRRTLGFEEQIVQV